MYPVILLEEIEVYSVFQTYLIMGSFYLEYPLGKIYMEYILETLTTLYLSENIRIFGL